MGIHRISRRKFLTGSVAGTAGMLLPQGIRSASATKPAGSSLSDVKHVVVLMQENRSFDHYFGSLQGVRGFADRAALRLRDGASVTG